MSLLQNLPKGLEKFDISSYLLSQMTQEGFEYSSLIIVFFFLLILNIFHIFF